MTYKTILVHCTDERRLGHLLAPAISLTRHFSAHLVGLSVMPPVLYDPTLLPAGGSTVIDDHCKAYAKEQDRMKTAFESAVAEAGISSEWTLDDARQGTVWGKIVEHARSADLVVAAQADSGWLFSNLIEAPADIVLQSGRPVLFVPNAGDHASFGRRVLVAWNGRRESARAAFDALPLLKAADDVSVAWINPTDDTTAGDVPAADLCTSLARHGVKCEATVIDKPDQHAGETLLDRIRQTNRDLLVMGCYGHSRFREFVLGGATREVLRGMKVPVLMSH